MKRVLFVDDEQAILDGLRNVLRADRRRWRMRFAASGEAALAELQSEPADVVVSDMRMPGMDGVAFLQEVRERFPTAARVVLSGFAELASVAKAAAVAHQYLLKPCDPEVLRALLERTCALQDVLQSDTLRRTIGKLGALPSSPRTYQALTQALEDPDVPIKRLAAIVEGDMGMSSRVLQFVNSAYFGLLQRITGIEAAIAYLGINTVRHLALTLEVSSAFRVDDADALADLERHGYLTARIARRLVPQDRAEAAFAAGLLHDAGKLVLLSRVREGYEEAQRRARDGAAPELEAEREVIGADHAEVGAYLLGLWGLPHSIIEGVAFHHQEAAAPSSGALDVCAAVRLANLLAHEALGTRPQTELLARMAGDRLAAWREVAVGEARIPERG
jgi:HD-like signal output (HDOD) protein